MKNYNIIAPEEKNFCICSCLQAIFDFEGKKFAQKDIAKKLNFGKEGFKVHDNQIKKFLFEIGFNYVFYWRNETPLNEPELVLDDMKKDHGLIGIKHHSYLFYDFKYPKIQLKDPNDGKIKIKEYNQMIKEMYNTEGFFALIKKIN